MAAIVAAWEQEANTAPVEHDPLFAEYVQKWIEKKSFSLKANSVKSYQDYADTHILPGLGHIKVRLMTLKDLQRYYGEKLKVLSVKGAFTRSTTAMYFFMAASPWRRTALCLPSHWAGRRAAERSSWITLIPPPVKPTISPWIPRSGSWGWISFGSYGRAATVPFLAATV